MRWRRGHRRPAAVLAGSGLAPAALLDAATRVSLRQLLAVHANALRLAPKPGFRCAPGCARASAHFGLYGYAANSQRHGAFRAIDFALRYRAFASPLIGLAFEHRPRAGETVWYFDDPARPGGTTARCAASSSSCSWDALWPCTGLLGARATAPRAPRDAALPTALLRECSAARWPSEAPTSCASDVTGWTTARFASPVVPGWRAICVSCWPRWSTQKRVSGAPEGVAAPH